MEGVFAVFECIKKKKKKIRYTKVDSRTHKGKQTLHINVIIDIIIIIWNSTTVHSLDIR